MAERREALVGTLVETLCQPSELAQNPGGQPHGSSDFIGLYRLGLAARAGAPLLHPVPNSRPLTLHSPTPTLNSNSSPLATNH